MTLEYKTAKIFPIPVRNFKLPSLTTSKIAEIIDIIDNECTWNDWSDNSLRASWTNEQNILDDPRLKDVKEEVVEAFNIFKNEENHRCGEIKMMCSWANKLTKGQHIIPHMHQNSYLAATIHLSKGSNLVLQHPTVYDRYGVDFDEKDIIPAVEFPIQVGHLVMFPGKLVHAVKKQELDTPRYSLAMNGMPNFFGRPTAYVDFR